MSTSIPHDSDLDLFGHLLEYAQSEEYQQIAQEQKAKKTAIATETMRRYRAHHPSFAAMREQARKHKPKLFKRQRGLCRWCKQALGDDYTVDHIVSLTKGGTNDLHNLCVCHRSCNSRKGAG